MNKYYIQIKNEKIVGNYFGTLGNLPTDEYKEVTEELFYKYDYLTLADGELIIDEESLKIKSCLRIDQETSVLIKQWCKDQGKCEEYYLRQPKESDAFILYNTKVSEIIAEQAVKKEAIINPPIPE